MNDRHLARRRFSGVGQNMLCNHVGNRTLMLLAGPGSIVCHLAGKLVVVKALEDVVRRFGDLR